MANNEQRGMKHYQVYFTLNQIKQGDTIKEREKGRQALQNLRTGNPENFKKFFGDREDDIDRMLGKGVTIYLDSRRGKDGEHLLLIQKPRKTRITVLFTYESKSLDCGNGSGPMEWTLTSFRRMKKDWTGRNTKPTCRFLLIRSQIRSCARKGI